MITVSTHKRHRSPFKHSKTIYVFTSGQVIVTVQIHSKQKAFKEVKMTTAKWTIITREQRICTILLQDLMKRGVCWCGVEMPSVLTQCKEQLEFCFHKRYYDSFERRESTLSIRSHPLVSGG
jgi:ATP/ADP translocase